MPPTNVTPGLKLVLEGGRVGEGLEFDFVTPQKSVFLFIFSDSFSVSLETLKTLFLM